MQLTHSGITYECAVAVKCTDDNYIKLFDANGVEIASFYNISDFSEFTLLDGSFIAPCDCNIPILLTTYSIGGRTIKTTDWILSDSGQYYYAIENNSISSNTTTCDIMLFFAAGTEINYTAMQGNGKIVLYVDEIPNNDIVIESIHITRA